MPIKHVFVFCDSENAQQMQTNAHADIHIHTRPPSSHSAKPSACPTLPSRMFWTAGVMCFFQ